MPLMDEFKEEREALKQKSLKEKFGYFWYYNKTTVIVISCIALFVLYMVYDVATKKDTAFYAAFINCTPTYTDSEFMEDFTALTDIDTDKYDAYLDTSISFKTTGYDQLSMNNTQKFLALCATEQIDVVVAESSLFASYANQGLFKDLDLFLTDEQLAKYGDCLFYFDEAILDREVNYDLKALEAQLVVDVDEQRSAEGKELPKAVGVFLSGDMKDRLTQAGYYSDSQELVIGFLGSEERSEYDSMFFDWITEAE